MVPKRLVFPATLFCLNLGAAIGCFACGDWKRGIYWVASAICVACVAL